MELDQQALGSLLRRNLSPNLHVYGVTAHQ